MENQDHKASERKLLDVEKLTVNPRNDRFMNSVDDEKSAIFEMFNINSGDPKNEMIELAKDIVENGLHKHEQPIVYYQEESDQYILIDGNRRITTIKLMSQYNEDEEIREKLTETYMGKYDEIAKNSEIPEEILCVVYYDENEARELLPKIHTDTTDHKGRGRKPWNAHAKEKYKEREGDISKTRAIIKYLEEHENTTDSLLKKMNENKWTSKLERVVSYADFPRFYLVEFGKNNELILNSTEDDNEEKIYNMLVKLINDLIKNTAELIRIKENFFKYYNSLSDEYKATNLLDVDILAEIGIKEDIDDEDKEDIDDEDKEDIDDEDKEDIDDEDKEDIDDEDKEDIDDEDKEDIDDEDKEDIDDEDKEDIDDDRLLEPIKREDPFQRAQALSLTRPYSALELSCLGEKPKTILEELISLDVNKYPYAASTLARSILESIAYLWHKEEGLGFEIDNFQADNLFGALKATTDKLGFENKWEILEKEEHSSIMHTLGSDKFVKFLNNTIHSSEFLAVQPERLKDGWIACRLLIEKYIEYKGCI